MISLFTDHCKLSFYAYVKYVIISIKIVEVLYLEFLLMLSKIHAGWDNYSSYCDRIACVYAFLSSCNCQCHYHFPPCIFGCGRRLLGTFLCLCNCYLYWGIISCRFCYFHCNNFSHCSCHDSYRYSYLLLFFPLFRFLRLK